MNAVRDDRQRVAARVERERLAGVRGEVEADNCDPPVAEMSNLRIKTL